MAPPVPLRFWELVDRAMEIPDARTLHLSIGRPPMVRVGEEGLRPLADDLPIVTFVPMQLMLSTLVEPDRWETLERVGEGEINLIGGAGRGVSLTLFRSSEAWSAVVHL